MVETENLDDIVNSVYETLNHATIYHKGPEVIATAMTILKKDNTLKVSEALSMALIEWNI